jgi:hypothetical protein
MFGCCSEADDFLKHPLRFSSQDFRFPDPACPWIFPPMIRRKSSRRNAFQVFQLSHLNDIDDLAGLAETNQHLGVAN